MKIEHIALWSDDIERLKNFYIKYFNAEANSKYKNSQKNYTSYFLSFNGGARLELMQMPDIPENSNDPLKQYKGFIHIAISVGSDTLVEKITEQLKSDGYRVISGPRHTGDGYYESCILDPDSNRIEITV